MIAYNEALRKLLDPIWEQEYLQKIMSMPLEQDGRLQPGF
jgi:hypothetical protein